MLARSSTLKGTGSRREIFTMELGPEPQELFERVEQHQEVAEHLREEEAKKREHIQSAITAAILAVCAALGALLAGHSANDAIIAESKASDQWAYYQSKSTKSQIYELGRDLVRALSTDGVASSSRKSNEVLERFAAKVKKYGKEKDDIGNEARKLEQESAFQLQKHNQYSLGIACFQIGIVLASISILVPGFWFYWGSVTAGGVGIIYLILGAATRLSV